MIKLGLFLVIATLYPSLAIGQEDKSFKTAAQVGIASGKSKIDRTSPIYKTPILIVTIDNRGGWHDESFSFRWSSNEFGGYSINGKINGKIFSIGPVTTGIDFKYFLSKEDEVVWKDSILLISGDIRKQYALTGFNVSIGEHLLNHVHFFARIGASEMNKQLVYNSLSDNYFNNLSTLVNKDLIPMFNAGAHAQWLDLWRFNIEVKVDYIESVKLGQVDRVNTRFIIPKEQLLSTGSIDFELMKWLDITTSYEWASDDQGMVFLGNSYGVGLKFKF